MRVFYQVMGERQLRNGRRKFERWEGRSEVSQWGRVSGDYRCQYARLLRQRILAMTFWGGVDLAGMLLLVGIVKRRRASSTVKKTIPKVGMTIKKARGVWRGPFGETYF